MRLLASRGFAPTVEKEVPGTPPEYKLWLNALIPLKFKVSSDALIEYSDEPVGIVNTKSSKNVFVEVKLLLYRLGLRPPRLTGLPISPTNKVLPGKTEPTLPGFETVVNEPTVMVAACARLLSKPNNSVEMATLANDFMIAPGKSTDWLKGAGPHTVSRYVGIACVPGYTQRFTIECTGLMFQVEDLKWLAT
jgi:hypothetical protein